MEEPEYYVKKIGRDDSGSITRVKVSEELRAKPERELKRKKVVKHLNKGKHLRTSYLDNGNWTDGDVLELRDGNVIRTSGNDEEADNLGNLRSF